MKIESLPQLELPKSDNVSPEDRQKLKDLSQEFEAVFLDLVFQSMRKTVPKGELTDGGAGEDIFRSMLDQEYSKTMSKQNLTGIASTIEKDLLKLMEIQNTTRKIQEGLKQYSKAEE